MKILKKILWCIIPLVLLYSIIDYCSEKKETVVTLVYYTGISDNYDYVVKEISELSDYELPKPTKVGHTFEGWYLDVKYETKYEVSKLQEGINELYAKYSINEYTITVEGEEKEYKFKYNEEIKLDDLTREEYTFNGYYLDKEFTKKFTLNNMPAENIKLYTNFEPIRYKLTILVDDNNYGYLDGETVQYLAKGETSSMVEAFPNLGYKFKSWSSGETSNQITDIIIEEDTIIYANFTIEYLELPVLEINTKDNMPVDSKEDYVKCNVSVSNSKYEYNFDLISGKIKGRGNSTWSMPKKPYKLKFDKKVDLFGNGAAKEWTLIANFCDKSLARNYIAYELGKLLGSDYCTTTQFVDLYLNGEYLGVYLICEQNEVGKTRVDIDESYDDPNTGYLLELDTRAPEEGVENIDWFISNERMYGIKSPDTEDENFNEDFVIYIKNYLDNAYEAILSKDINRIKEYIDLESFAKSYIVHEVMNCMDVGFSSFYIFKDKDDKLKSGPLWDFDISSGNYDYNITDPEQSYTRLWAKEANPWYNQLLELPEFVEIVREELKENYIKILKVLDEVNTQLFQNQNAFLRNFEKWDILGVYVWPNSSILVEINTWQEQVTWLIEWIQKSVEYVYNYYLNCDEVFVPQEICSLIGHNYNENNICKVCGEEAVNFSELTFIAFGDSITYGADLKIGGRVKNPYPTIVNEILGLKSYENKGISGATLTINNQGLTCMTDVITSYNFNADIIGVLGGVNDYNRNLPLGDIDDNDSSTIYGALHVSMSYLTENYSDSFIFYMTPYKEYFHGVLWSDINSQGYNLEDVANAIKEVAQIYNIPVLDLFEEGNFESVMYNDDCDGIHPNQEFITNVMAPQIASFIKENYA